MWRAFFLAIGISCCIVGAEALAIERAVLVGSSAPVEGNPQQNGGGRRVITPPPWAPWSLMAGGAVVVLYSFTIPARVRG